MVADSVMQSQSTPAAQHEGGHAGKSKLRLILLLAMLVICIGAAAVIVPPLLNQHGENTVTDTGTPGVTAVATPSPTPTRTPEDSAAPIACWICNACGTGNSTAYNNCTYCGASMDGRTPTATPTIVPSTTGKYPVYFDFGMIGEKPVIDAGDYMTSAKVNWQLTDKNKTVIEWPNSKDSLNEQYDLELEPGNYTLTYFVYQEYNNTTGWVEAYRLQFAMNVKAQEDNTWIPNFSTPNDPDLSVYKKLLALDKLSADKVVFVRVNNGEW